MLVIEKSFPLNHFDPDLFLYYPYPETPAVPGSMTFTVGFDQKAAQVVIEALNGEGLRTLTRVRERK